MPASAAHPLRFYFDYGLRVTVNTDNRLITDTTVTKELLARSTSSWASRSTTSRDHRQRASRAPSCPTGRRRDLLAAVNREIAEVRDRFGAPAAPPPAGAPR